MSIKQLQLSLGLAHSITWNEAKFCSMLEEYIASRLLRVDADTIVGNDGRGGRWADPTMDEGCSTRKVRI